MKKLILFVLLSMPVVISAQNNATSAERLATLKAEAEAKAKAAQEAAQKAIEAAKAAEEAAKAVAAEVEKLQKESQQQSENKRIAAENEAKRKATEKQKAENERIAAEKFAKQKELETEKTENNHAQQWVKPVIPTQNENNKSKEKKQEIKQIPEEDEKYLAGAVPLVNGQVQWETTFSTENTTEQNYQTLLQFLAGMTKEPDQLPSSSVSLVNESQHTIVARFEEWIVFASNLISIDRTKFIYNLIATCEGNQVNVRIFRINYIYEEERTNNSLIKAEEWITDKVSLNKKQTKLNRISGKFRKKTIDRKDQIFNNIRNVLNAK